MLEITEIEQTTDFAPSQWEGKFSDGSHFYARYRFGFLYMAKGDTEDEAVFGETVAGKYVGGPYDSVMTTEKMLELIQLEEYKNIPADAITSCGFISNTPN